MDCRVAGRNPHSISCTVGICNRIAPSKTIQISNPCRPTFPGIETRDVGFGITVRNTGALRGIRNLRLNFRIQKSQGRNWRCDRLKLLRRVHATDHSAIYPTMRGFHVPIGTVELTDDGDSILLCHIVQSVKSVKRGTRKNVSEDFSAGQVCENVPKLWR